MDQENRVDRALANLKHALWAFNAAMEPYFDKDPSTEGDERTWEHRYASLRRSLLKMANDIVDEYGPPDAPKGDLDATLRTRVEVLWDIYSSMLERWAIIKTDDGKAFTFTKEDGAHDAG